ncbi:MAG: alpha/beta hydrolase [Chloroflexaceae bacterium]|jgi:hypothetical protein|nr:alpha/beta hydrolase [Chloroflexaceae bacterium]
MKQRRHFPNWLRRLATLAMLGFLLLNLLAFVQVRAMTNFVPEGQPLSSLREADGLTLARSLLLGVAVPRPRNVQTPADHYLPFETRQIGLANAEQLEAWYVPHPQPLGLVVMFTGYAGVKDGLLTPAAHMYQWGYSSLLVDFRGSGGSSRNDTTMGIREAEDVAAAFAYGQTLAPGQPVLLYGVSMGSAAILRAVAVEGVQPAGLILEGAFDSLYTTTRHRFDALWLPSFPAAELLLFWGSVQMGYNAFAHNPAAYAQAVQVPTLLMSGADDPWIRPTEAEAIFNGLRGPKELLLFPGIGHEMPFVWREEARWKEAVQDFLATVRS